jgi:23S rRNA pseudouridine2605 synthase
MRKRRPRVGERPQSPQRVTGGNYNNNNRNWNSQSSNGPARPNKSVNAKPVKKLKKKKPFKQVKYKENADPSTPIRLNKYLANAGVCSRREADEFIQAGVVKVNGEVVTELGTKITRADRVMFHNQPVQLESKVYVLLNKPKGFVTTTDDPENRKTVMELVKSAASERIYPVGRLDRATTGVLLLTNDGDLASKLTHPKYEKRKIYQVWLDKAVAMEHMQMIADGIELEDGEIHADAISYVTEEDLSQIGIEIHSGRNRVIRRIFEKLGYRVVKLDRVYFAGLTKKKLSRGKWRYLSEQEVNMLRMGAFD